MRASVKWSLVGHLPPVNGTTQPADSYRQRFALCLRVPDLAPVTMPNLVNPACGGGAVGAVRPDDRARDAVLMDHNIAGLGTLTAQVVRLGQHGTVVGAGAMNGGPVAPCRRCVKLLPGLQCDAHDSASRDSRTAAPTSA